MVRALGVVFSMAVLSCSRATPAVEEVCQTTADCGQGLVCIGQRCGACRADSECPSPAKCGLISSGRCGCFDADGDGSSCDDCDDADPARFPSATEVCDGRDNDCDGDIDEGANTTWFVDADGDGFGNAGLTLMRCQAPANFVAKAGDCNDGDPTTYPGRSEVCDGRDNDCDGEIDEAVKSTFYRDADGDGFGDARNTASTCQLPSSGFVTIAGDCDDTRADANPVAMETCNNRDDDCDGVVDGLMRSCANACGEGQETCNRGVWAGCTAPPIVTVSTVVTLSGARASYDCLIVGNMGRLVVPAEMTLETRNWLRVEATGTIELGPRSTISSVGDIIFADRGVLLANDATVRSSSSVQVTQDAKWYAQAPQAAPYSTGGSAACAAATERVVSGAGGGARGGMGGRGSTCTTLVTQARASAGGPQALAGSDGCGCDCAGPNAGAFAAGGWGGGPLAGGGGAANGGAGGIGGRGRFPMGTGDGGAGGSPESTLNGVPEFGGAAGGSSGSLVVTYAPESCQGAGGAGGGIIRVFTPRFTNQGLLAADGANGETPQGLYSMAGGGGGGAGGSWVFHIDTFDNRTSVSAIGGRGGNGVSRGTDMFAGGGGGGGGGRIFIGALDGGSAAIVSLGNLFVGGGIGGTGPGADGTNGSSGVVLTR